jgi:outer membrane protein assembly factor BamB
MAPPKWLWGLWIVAGGYLVALRYVMDIGDVGLANGQTMGIGLLVAMVSLAWFVFRSGFTARVRYGTLLAVIAAVVLFRLLFQIDGFRSEIIPIVSFRYGGAAPELAMARAGGFADVTTTTDADFPQFLGPGRDLRVDNVALARDWEASPPELLWKQGIGAGWSGFAVVNGYAATLEQRDDAESVTLYDVDTGALIWSLEIGSGFSHVLGGEGPRSTPSIAGGLVYAMGVNGRLVAIDGASGTLLWSHDLLAEFGISAEEETADVSYGRSSSPLVVGDAVVIPVGGPRDGRVSLAAYHALTGERLWQGGAHNVSMSSPAIATLLDREQIVLANENWVSGHDAATGQQLWEFEWPGITSADSNVSQAVPVPPDRVFISKGYGGGAALYQLEQQGQAMVPTRLWGSAASLRTKLTNVVIRDGYVYGLSEGILECVELDTGKREWKAGRYHHGQILLVGDVLLVLTEDGEIVMVEATPERRNSELGRFQAIDGHTWNNFALYGDILLVRNGREAAAYRLPLR